jgi:hypothetical protein
MVTELYECICRNCGQRFDPVDSDACRFANFCGRDCELEAVDNGLARPASELETLHSVQ